MFLDWIAQLHLLQHDAQTNILNVLPVSTRRTLISEITSYLHPAAGKAAPHPSIFASPAHVKWFMEVIGQGFNLPLEDMTITSEDINIYAQWLFEANQRPAAVSREGLEQEFFQIIFHQYSLLFRPRVPRPHSGASKTATYTTTTVVPAPGAANLITIPMVAPSPPPITRESAAQLTQRHIELCKKVLTVFTMAGRTLDLSEETWSVLLKVVLGITDSLLSERVSDGTRNGPIMGDELCDHLLRVLFELWLRSKTRDVEMWDILKRCFVRWTHRPKVIQQWSSVALSLTHRTLRFLYGPTAGTSVVNIAVNGFNVKLDLPQDFVYYAWHRILFLIPNPWQLSPGNFALAVMGVGRIVEAFHSVGQVPLPDSETPSPADGNTLLHIFGGWLFDACFSAPQVSAEYQQGRAEAYGILCRIFSKPQRRVPFLRLYIERFYAALAIGLRSDTCLPTILMNSTELFATDLEGVRLMVPDFVVGIKSILPKMQPEYRNVVSVDELRLAAIKVTSTIMCLPNHFENVSLKPDWDRGLNVASDNVSMIGEQEQLVSQLMKVLYAQQSSQHPAFTSLKYYILELLLMSLRTETSSYNMRYLLHLINVYVVEDVPFCPGLVGTVVKLIQDKILTMQLSSDVTLVAFDVLMDFVGLYEYVKRDSKNVARELVLALCRYADTLNSTGNLAQKYPLVVQAYDCMMRWVMVGQWIVDDRDCQHAVIATLSRGITIFEREIETNSQSEGSHEKKKRRDTGFPPTKQLFQLPNRASKGGSGNQSNDADKATSATNKNGMAMHRKEEIAVKMAAEYCMSQFVNQLGNFPPWKDQVGPTRTSTLLDDLSLIKAWKKSKSSNAISQQNNDDGAVAKRIQLFLLDGRVIAGLMDISDLVETNGESPKSPAVVLICRDTTGRYSWTSCLRYEDLTSKASPATPRSTSSTSSSPKYNPTLLVRAGSSPTLHNGHLVKSTASIPVAEAVNWMALPSLEQLLIGKPEKKSDLERMTEITSLQQHAEQDIDQHDPLQIPKAAPESSHSPIDQTPSERLFMSQLGFLHTKNRNNVIPLRITDSLISELEMLDMLNERDCISISTYFAQSGNTTEKELVEQPPELSQSYLQFLYSLGWPVKLSEHRGYRGKVDSAICDVIPYYADRMVEVVFHNPYFLHEPKEGDLSWGAVSRLPKLHQQVTQDDHVCIIWIEDMTNWESLAHRIKTMNGVNSKSMVYIFINPLVGAVDGLYWIRISIPSVGNTPSSIVASQRLKENALIFGPLVDGMIVSRHALGAMVRNTAISAHQACRVVTDSFTRPYVIRKHFIEEMAHRHSSKLSLSEFYSDVFVQR